MNRAELETYIIETYNIEKDHPWASYPNYAVFRHYGNRKWFAVVMDVSRDKLGLHNEDMIDVVNLKCDPVLIGLLLAEPGFFPAYHMNKENWITAALDGSASDDRIKMLLDMSFEATMPKRKRRE